jgi:DNA-binding NarL/FixJ family response regulator
MEALRILIADDHPLFRHGIRTLLNAKLVLSPTTVRNYVSNVFVKLQVADRAQAIIKVRDAGLG